MVKERLGTPGLMYELRQISYSETQVLEQVWRFANSMYMLNDKIITRSEIKKISYAIVAKSTQLVLAKNAEALALNTENVSRKLWF